MQIAELGFPMGTGLSTPQSNGAAPGFAPLLAATGLPGTALAARTGGAGSAAGFGMTLATRAPGAATTPANSNAVIASPTRARSMAELLAGTAPVGTKVRPEPGTGEATASGKAMLSIEEGAAEAIEGDDLPDPDQRDAAQAGAPNTAPGVVPVAPPPATGGTIEIPENVDGSPAADPVATKTAPKPAPAAAAEPAPVAATQPDAQIAQSDAGIVQNAAATAANGTAPVRTARTRAAADMLPGAATDDTAPPAAAGNASHAAAAPVAAATSPQTAGGNDTAPGSASAGAAAAPAVQPAHAASPDAMERPAAASPTANPASGNTPTDAAAPAARDVAPAPSAPAPSASPAPAPVAPSLAPQAAAPAQPAVQDDAPTVSARAGVLGKALGVEIARKVADGDETVRVRLNPAELGRIEVTLSFDDKGALRATVRADHPAALDLLRRDSADLARSLDQAGVRADSQSFRFESRSDGNHGGGFAGQQQHQHQRGYPGRGGDLQPDLPGAESAYRSLRGTGRVDLLA